MEINPVAWVLPAAVVAFLAWSRYANAQRLRKSIAAFSHEDAFLPGNETTLQQALRWLVTELENGKGPKNKIVRDLLQLHRGKVLRAIDQYLEKLPGVPMDAESYPADIEAGSAILGSAIEAYGTEPEFRRALLDRLRNQASVEVWHEILLEMSMSEPFMDDGNAFRDALAIYREFEESSPIRESAEIASLLVEWAHDADAVPEVEKLRPTFEAKREKAPETALWDEVLSNLEPSSPA